MKGLREIVSIRDLKRQALSVAAIARKVGCDRKTLRRHLERGLEPPAYTPRAPVERIVAPYEASLRERVARVPRLHGEAPFARDPGARICRRLFGRDRLPLRGPVRAAAFLRTARRGEPVCRHAFETNGERRGSRRRWASPSSRSRSPTTPASMGPASLGPASLGKPGSSPSSWGSPAGSFPLALGPVPPRTCRPCCAVTSLPSPRLGAPRPSSSTTG